LWNFRKPCRSNSNFPRRVVLFLKTEMGNPLLNSTWSNLQSIYIEWHQKKSITYKYTSVNTVSSPKTATAWSAPKDGISFKEIQHSQHQSIDRKHISRHVKFKVGLIISFMRKSKYKKNTFHGGWSVLFAHVGVCKFH
jgi:hypothetical protein